MRALEIIVYAISVLVTVGWVWGIRTNVQKGVGITWPTATIVTFWVVTLVAVPLLRVSAFHLLWLLPAQVLLGPISLFVRILWLRAHVLVVQRGRVEAA